jgi:ribose 5-phosphate isomerase B
MKIAIGNDHAATALKFHVVEYIKSKGHEVINLGTDDYERTDYPRRGEAVARAVVSGQADRGIVLCGTGVGISLAANKVHGIRCACVSEPISAKMCRAHNDCNMIAFGERIVGPQTAEAIVDAFLETEAEGGRHAMRVQQIMEIEARQG